MRLEIRRQSNKTLQTRTKVWRKEKDLKLFFWKQKEVFSHKSYLYNKVYV